MADEKGKTDNAKGSGFLNSKNAYTGILLMGVVSLMGDIVYEGSRGLVPEYLKFLGASALVVGLIGGLGEFIGYALRLVSGFLADTTRAYWLFIFCGYGLIVSIPLLGFTSGWKIAIILVLFERIGKALRAPSRDTVLSIISKDVGAGKAFGIHELLDQVGAVLGPIIVTTLMFYSNNNYRQTFSSLLLPFLMLLIALAYTYRKVGSKMISETKAADSSGKKLEKPFYIYTLAVLFNTIGLIPAALILYKASVILPPEQQYIVPLFYLVIQGVDASVALIAGYAYDKFGVKFLALPFILSMFPPLFTMIDAGLLSLAVASAFFGIVLGMQESIYRAAVTKFAPISSRGTAYGIFNTAYGVGFIISGGIYGALMDWGAPLSVTLLFVVVLQAAAVITLLRTQK